MSHHTHTAERSPRARELAQHFTPKPVAEMIWRVARQWLEPGVEARLRVIDPAAGGGVFLDVVLEGGDVPPGQVHGIELDGGLASVLSEPAAGARMHWGDALLQTFRGVESDSFDLVIGNPPFGRLRHMHERCEDVACWEAFDVWRCRSLSKRRSPAVSPAACGVELLFLERALQLARPDGIVALVMPEGFLANARLQWARDWVLSRATPLAIAELPAAVFRGATVNARAGVVFLRKGTSVQDTPVRLLPGFADGRAGEPWTSRTVAALTCAGRARKCRETVVVSSRRLAGKRWDPKFWRAAAASRSRREHLPCSPLGDFVEHIAYGPIVTGQRPQPQKRGIRIIRQGDFVFTGLRSGPALYVKAGSVFDPQRTRVRSGDLLMPRSGAGALGRNRLAVFVDGGPANVGCFVDLIRLVGLNPFYVWLFLKTAAGWAQIRCLINGVGTPNINFSEIRSLRIPRAPDAVQQKLERRYRQDVLPLHRKRERDAARKEAERQFGVLIREVEDFLKSGTYQCRACQ